MITCKLFYHPSDASMAPHMILEEIGKPFALHLVHREHGEHKTPDYLKLNPNGLIPVLIDGDQVLYESAAICLHLADTNPQSKLIPALGTAERSQCYKWLMWLANTVHSTLNVYFYPERWVDAGNERGEQQVQAHAEKKVGDLLAQLEAQLEASGGPWLLGEQYTILDPYAFMLCRWTRGFNHPARERPVIRAYLERMLARPAVQRAIKTERLADPIV